MTRQANPILKYSGKNLMAFSSYFAPIFSHFFTFFFGDEESLSSQSITGSWVMESRFPFEEKIENIKENVMNGAVNTLAWRANAAASKF